MSNVFHLFIGAEEQLADNLTKVAAIDINNLLTKTSDISKGVMYNICQTLLKEWGPYSLGVLPEDTLQELLTGVIQNFNSNFYQSFQSFLMFIPTSLGHFNSISSYLCTFRV